MRESPVLTGLAVNDATAPPFAARAYIIDGQIRLEPTGDAGKHTGSERTVGEGTRPVAIESILLPGLINLHDHLRAFMPTGRRHEGSALAQVITASAATQAVAEPTDYRALTALASARQIRAGVTSAIDHVYPLHRPGLLEAVVAGHRQVGLRASVALGIMTRGRADICTSADDVVALAERSADVILPREQLFLAPVSLRQTKPEDFATAVTAADRLGLRLYTHIAETQSEVDLCLAEHGVRPLELLHRMGFLRPGTVLVHGIWLNDHEIELLARTGAAIVYCPTNHLKLAKGFAPVTDLLAAGVTVGLGIDGMESLFHEMRQAVFAQSHAKQDTAALSSTAAFAMATTSAARALDLPRISGTLAGAPDLVRLDASRVGLQPLRDPVWSVVHRAGPGDVADVVINGQFVLRDGQFTRADESALIDEADAVTRRLAERSGAHAPHEGDFLRPPTAPASATNEREPQ